jgi:hypothetical protein
VGTRFPAGQSPIGSQPEKVQFEIGGGFVYDQLMTAPRSPGDNDLARIIRHAPSVISWVHSFLTAYNEAFSYSP